MSNEGSGGGGEWWGGAAGCTHRSPRGRDFGP